VEQGSDTGRALELLELDIKGSVISLGIMTAKFFRASWMSLSGVILMLAGASLLSPSRPFVSMRFCGFETNRYGVDTLKWELVSAIIEVTNCSRQAVAYSAFYHEPKSAAYNLLYLIGGSWTNFDPGTDGSLARQYGWSLRQLTLGPLQGFVFKPDVIRTAMPCKVVVVYHPVRSTNGINRVAALAHAEPPKA
jgi:hypothetical protein